MSVTISNNCRNLPCKKIASNKWVNYNNNNNNTNNEFSSTVMDLKIEIYIFCIFSISWDIFCYMLISSNFKY